MHNFWHFVYRKTRLILSHSRARFSNRNRDADHIHTTKALYLLLRYEPMFAASGIQDPDANHVQFFLLSLVHFNAEFK